jgi:hypothetical protein
MMYYHTRSAIFAVAAGLCAKVMDASGVANDGHPIVGRPVSGVVRGNDFVVKHPLDAVRNVETEEWRLVIGCGTAEIVTEPIVRVESVTSFSIPPSASASIPPSLPPATLPFFTSVPPPTRRS